MANTNGPSGFEALQSGALARDPALMREVAQRSVEEVNKRIRNADMRKVALGFAVELIGPGVPGIPPERLGATAMALAEEFMAWIITGERQRDGAETDQTRG